MEEYKLNIEHNVSLQSYNTLAIPAMAKSMLQVENTEQLQAAIQFAKAEEMKLLVLGEGSNTVLAADIDALVLINRIKGKTVLTETQDDVTLQIGAGENWHQLVQWALQQRWYGLENLALIPGTVGAAPIQNIGAYGVELESVFVSLTCIDIESGETREFDKAQCQFAYRDSVFKHELRDKVIITSVTLQLQKQARNNLSYPALKQYFSDINVTEPLPNHVFEVVCKIRSSKLPDPKHIPNAGSFFKNPVVSKQQYDGLKQRYPDIVAFEMADGMKLAAGWLIEKAGWKAKSINDVATHDQQALVLVNPKHQSGEQVISFAKQLQMAVNEMFAIELEIEPRIYS